MNDPANWTGLLAFNYERSLSEYIAAYPHRLEDGFLPHPYEKVREKVFKNKKRSDVLLVDQEGGPVVVECKQYQPSVSDIRQLRGYMRSLKAETGEEARGILVHGGARKLSADVRREAEKNPEVELVKYVVEVDFLASQ